MEANKFIPALVIGLALILSATIFGGFYYSAQSANTNDILSVTGSAKTQVTSDQAKLVVALSRTAPVSELATANQKLASDLASVLDLLKKEGVEDSSIVKTPVSMNQRYDYKEDPNTELRYDVVRSVTVQSNDVNKLTAISEKIPDLTKDGATISVQSLEYYYSKLPDLRVELLSAAVEDAKARADKIASGTGRNVGNVQSASIGVVQVLQPNSIEVSDYGSYDTSSIEKEVMVTVRAAFRLR
ncbi:MAG: SIMPL domain-containing protein [Patescibacteria group bacterium]